MSLLSDEITKNEKITNKLFEDELNKIHAKNYITVSNRLNDYIVYYENTNHTYSIDNHGNVSLIDNIKPTEKILVVY